MPQLLGNMEYSIHARLAVSPSKLICHIISHNIILKSQDFYDSEWADNDTVSRSSVLNHV